MPGPPPPWEAHRTAEPGLGPDSELGPDPDDDTAPVNVVPVEDEATVVVVVRHPPVDVHYPPPARRDVGGWTDSYRPPPRPEDTFAGRFTAPLSITPRPVSNHPKGIHSGVVVAGVALVALAGWLLWPSGDSDATKPTVASPPPTIDVDAQEQLMNVLPVVNCPGNTQSPGPLRRNATPQRTAGTLVCGLGAGGRPVVAWTTDATLVLDVVRADPEGPTLSQLYKWRSSHS